MADLIAELGGYQAELARYERLNLDARAQAVRDQVSRLVAVITTEAEKLDAAADNHMTAGQDLHAARATVEARRLRAALVELGLLSEAAETAADTTPRETAVRKRGSHA